MAEELPKPRKQKYTKGSAGDEGIGVSLGTRVNAGEGLKKYTERQL